MIKHEDNNSIGTAWQSHALWKALVQYRHISWSKWQSTSSRYLLKAHVRNNQHTGWRWTTHVIWSTKLPENFCICCKLYIIWIFQTHVWIYVSFFYKKKEEKEEAFLCIWKKIPSLNEQEWSKAVYQLLFIMMLCFCCLSFPRSESLTVICVPQVALVLVTPILISLCTDSWID